MPIGGAVFLPSRQDCGVEVGLLRRHQRARPHFTVARHPRPILRMQQDQIWLAVDLDRCAIPAGLLDECRAPHVARFDAAHFVAPVRELPRPQRNLVCDRAPLQFAALQLGDQLLHLLQLPAVCAPHGLDHFRRRLRYVVQQGR